MGEVYKGNPVQTTVICMREFQKFVKRKSKNREKIL